jgi:Domain of unknown function (DUF4192)
VQAVPYLLGYADLGDDLVLIATREHLAVLTVAVDLNSLADVHLWTATAPALERAGATEVHLIAYPAAPVNDARLAHLHAAFTAAVGTHPDKLTAGLLATTARGRCWTHNLTAPAPTGPGLPVPEDSALTLSLSLAHGAPAATRAHLLATLRPHPASVLDAVTAAISAMPRALRDDLLKRATRALERRRHRPQGWSVAEAADVLQALTDTTVRDQMVLRSPDPHAAWTWLSLLPFAPTSWRAPVGTLAALAAHQRGDGLTARACVQQALAADPGYRLARMVTQVLDLGLTPTQVRTHVLEPAARQMGRGR